MDYTNRKQIYDDLINGLKEIRDNPGNVLELTKGQKEGVTFAMMFISGRKHSKQGQYEENAR